jgi:hypothetical protein
VTVRIVNKRRDYRVIFSCEWVNTICISANKGGVGELIKRFNDFLAKYATLALGTMWAFYLFLLYSLLPLVFPQSMDKLLYWSNVIQLITLPLLAVGTSILGKNADERARQDHKAIMEELETIKKMYQEIQVIRQNVDTNNDQLTLSENKSKLSDY